MSFIIEDAFSKVAEGYASKCVEFTKKEFRIPLKGLEESIKHVDIFLHQLSFELETGKRDDLLHLARLYGSYVGEVYRFSHGGKWGKMHGWTIFTLGIKKGNQTFWPWSICHKILSGSSEKILDYYEFMKLYGSSPFYLINEINI